MHEFVTNDWFVLINGLCSVISLLISLFVASKVIKINNSMNIGTQTVKAKGNSTAAGRDAHVG